MDGELAYWQGISGLADVNAGLSAHIQAYLTSQNGGVSDDIESLYFKLYGSEYSYWAGVTGLSTGSMADLKYAAFNTVASGYGVTGYGVGGYGA